MLLSLFFFFFFNDTATTEIYTLSLHDALPICPWAPFLRVTSTTMIFTGYPIWGAASATPGEASRVSSRSWTTSGNVGSVRLTGDVGRFRMGSGYRRMGRTDTSRLKLNALDGT